MTGDGLAELRSEIAAFYAGFGQPRVLRQAFEGATLLVPLTSDDRVWTSQVGGVHWICAFTSVEEYARYMVARGVKSAETYRYHGLLGSHLASWAQACPEPTGVSIDCLGSAPMAFPPELPEAVLAEEAARG
ncbi:hypothetical protein [Nocardia huaxiensis]|uniref:SseB protein N-terminal domain-containing protein n=1 Tax=Nocardia huaxiensis TaxID=2755382 RepID=A0A7D6VB84_9NOCA|nr:hypothetical protein [Nocardia huaxiensis]QLY30102.1 hypothetical protein H0264_33820 [Nocardia huaxiensis]UFS96288.1 SseB family protein [Nocardia huaxiensis]